MTQYTGDAAWVNESTNGYEYDARRAIVRSQRGGLVNGSKSGGATKTATRATNPHPERTTAEAVILLLPGGMDVQPVSKFAVQHPQGGGTVGRKVQGRSKKSRHRLMRHLMSVDMGKIAAERKNAKFSRCLFLTLTYPWMPETYKTLEYWPNGAVIEHIHHTDNLPFTDHEAAKRHLKALRKRIELKWGLTWAVWVQEHQKSGALHFHIVSLHSQAVNVGTFRQWLSRAWFEIVGSDNPDHLKAGTQCEAVYVEQGEPAHLLGYLSKELGGFGAKSYQTEGINTTTGEILETGKTWGIWGRKAFDAMKVIVAVIRITCTEGWQAFKRGVSENFKLSKYLRKVASMAWWGGGLLYGNWERLLDKLIGGLNDKDWDFRTETL